MKRAKDKIYEELMYLVNLDSVEYIKYSLHYHIWQIFDEQSEQLILDESLAERLILIYAARS